MTTSKLPVILMSDEGYRAKPYKDSRGFWTGGVGHLLSTTAIYPKLYDSYTHADWMVAFGADIAAAERSLDQYIPWWRKLDDVRQDVMVMLAFNLSARKLAGWKHTLDDIKFGRFKAAAIDLENDQPWASQVKTRATRLALIMETGQEPPEQVRGGL